jgi:hypothetical protein
MTSLFLWWEWCNVLQVMGIKWSSENLFRNKCSPTMTDACSIYSTVGKPGVPDQSGISSCPTTAVGLGYSSVVEHLSRVWAPIWVQSLTLKQANKPNQPIIPVHLTATISSLVSIATVEWTFSNYYIIVELGVHCDIYKGSYNIS